MNIKDDEYINSFDIKNVEDIDQVIDFMKGKKSLATWKEAIKKIKKCVDKNTTIISVLNGIDS